MEFTHALVTQDTDGNRNIQEVKVKLSRNDAACPLPYANPGTVDYANPANPNPFNPGTLLGPPNEGEKLIPGNASLMLMLNLANMNTVMHGGLYHRLNNFRLAVNLPGFNNSNVDGVSKTFNTSGDWLFFGQLEDVTTELYSQY